MTVGQHEETWHVKGYHITSYSWLGSNSPDVIRIISPNGSIFSIKVRSSGDSAALEHLGNAKSVAYETTISSWSQSKILHRDIYRVPWTKLGKPHTESFRKHDDTARNLCYKKGIDWVIKEDRKRRK